MRDVAKPGPKRIVVVGGGAGGAELVTALARRAKRDGTELVLVDSALAHLWKPRLHEVAVGLLRPGEAEISYLALGQANGFSFVLGALTGLDTRTRTIQIGAVQDEDGGELLPAREIAYDTLVLAFGSQVNDFGIPGVVEHCHRLDSGEQAAAFQRRLMDAAIQVAAGRRDQIRIGIVGAGATGVELAAELHQAVAAMKRYGGLAGVTRLQVTLVDMAKRVLAAEAPRTSAFAHHALEQMNVDLRLDASVDRVTAEALHLKGGDVIPCELKVWASGEIGLPLAERLGGLQIDKHRRIVTDSFLSCKGVGDIYALGDCAAVLADPNAKPLPATAQVAHQQADYLIRRLGGAKSGQAERPFEYRARGSLVSLGGAAAAGQFPTSGKGSPLVLEGVLPKLAYASLQFMHRAALSGWSQACAYSLADRLRRVSGPAVKLHW